MERAQKMLAEDCTVGLSLSGALTPAGLAMSCLIPLIRAGFVASLRRMAARCAAEYRDDRGA